MWNSMLYCCVCCLRTVMCIVHARTLACGNSYSSDLNFMFLFWLEASGIETCGYRVGPNTLFVFLLLFCRMLGGQCFTNCEDSIFLFFVLFLIYLRASHQRSSLVFVRSSFSHLWLQSMSNEQQQKVNRSISNTLIKGYKHNIK